MSLKNTQTALFIQSMAEMQHFQHYRLVSGNPPILPQFSLAVIAGGGRGSEHTASRLEFQSIRVDVSTMVTRLREEADRTSVGRCHAHLDALATIQARFKRLSGTKLGNIPDLPVTDQMTMQSVFDLYMETLQPAWIMTTDTLSSMTDYPLFESMHALLGLYKEWRLLEDAIRPCLYTIGADDRRQLSGLDLSR